MKTTEALKIVADLAAGYRQLQQSAALTAKNHPGRNAAGLRAHYRKHAKDHGARAEALELLARAHAELRTEVRASLIDLKRGATSDMLDPARVCGDVAHNLADAMKERRP